MKKQNLKIVFKVFLIAFLSLAALLSVLFVSSVIAGFMQVDKNIQYQDRHLEYLKNEYYTDSYVPCDEQKLADFNLEKAFTEGVKLNEIAVMGTHNSYQLLGTLPKQGLMKTLQIISFGLVENKAVFEMDTFTEQLEQGIRNLEIDIETVDDEGDVSFIVTHKAIIDNVSSAYNLAKGLEEIAMWSDNNPGHLPVYLLIEPKDDVPSINNMKNFSLEYALELDKVLRQVLGDRLLTPQQVMGGYESFEEMRKADGWPALKQAAGKIIVLLHTCDVTQEYIDTDTSIKTQAMFPMLLFGDIDKPYASFILDNDPVIASENNKKTVDENNLMVRTRADNYPDFSDERYKSADNCGSHIITTDYPLRSVREKDHTYTFGGYTIKLLN
ncbi:MAG: hypothetical protein J6K64_03995 [Clostridia bacterium]|nr:hypothetical protein [Clostridia bacterium]